MERKPHVRSSAMDQRILALADVINAAAPGDHFIHLLNMPQFVASNCTEFYTTYHQICEFALLAFTSIYTKLLN